MPSTIRIALIVMTATLAGCVPIARGPAPPTVSARARPAGLPSELRRMSFDLAQFEGESADVVSRLRRASSDGTLDILALSGGGAGGAFGAGALVGLTRSGHRPDYPYRGTTDFRPEAMRALFDYGADCAERDRLWMSLPESLRRAEDAVRRLESESTAKEHGDAHVPCPAELRDR